tara:strand:- start:35 stop:310 length:276 start_codon:yes stop_codon:yes gene_type:complete
MAITGHALDYYDDETLCKGYYYVPASGSGNLPVVLVTPAWDGLVEEVHNKSRALAQAGYIALAVDVYGDGKTLTDMEELGPAVAPLMVLTT